MEQWSKGARKMTLGEVAALWRYPVKSMLGEELESCQVTERGLLGDRAYALMDIESGKIVSAKSPRKWARMFELRASYVQQPGAGGSPAPMRIAFPDGGTATTLDADVEGRLSAFFGREVRLATEPPAGARYESIPVKESDQEAAMVEYPLPNGFFDLGSLHLLATSTLAHLRGLYPQADARRGRFEAQRFRPNILVETPEGTQGFAENEWLGKTLAIGDEARIRVIGPAIRCVMTTLPQGDLPADPGILRTAAQHNQANVGAYALVVRGGVVRRGDGVG
ncbi:MAG: MOSC domain-containing protein, partial [Chloroflexi bacterium]|nr:MOSC domain-containing protein [Chloroflexota bacterium]